MRGTVKPGGRAFRCLVVDDSAFARKNIGRVVALAGGEVVGEASNGLEAVDLFTSLCPDLVLMDITMPEQDGLETLRKMVEMDRDAKVIMVSSMGHNDIVWKAICMGAKHFVTKPFKPGRVEAVIESVLGAGERNTCGAST